MGGKLFVEGRAPVLIFLTGRTGFSVQKSEVDAMGMLYNRIVSVIEFESNEA